VQENHVGFVFGTMERSDGRATFRYAQPSGRRKKVTAQIPHRIRPDISTAQPPHNLKSRTTPHKKFNPPSPTDAK